MRRKLLLCSDSSLQSLWCFLNPPLITSSKTEAYATSGDRFMECRISICAAVRRRRLIAIVSRAVAHAWSIRTRACSTIRDYLFGWIIKGVRSGLPSAWAQGNMVRFLELYSIMAFPMCRGSLVAQCADFLAIRLSDLPHTRFVHPAENWPQYQGF